jgi:hypothetical protein
LTLPVNEGGAGFTQCFYEPCMFVRRSGDNVLYLGVYCDDIISVYGRSDKGSVYALFCASLHDRWDAEDEGELNDILNVTIFKDGRDIVLTQTAYIDKMVDKYLESPEELKAFNAKQTPFTAHLKQNIEAALADDAQPPDAALTQRYMSIVGALMYCATVTRPDVAYPVGMLCRCMSRATPALYNEARQVLAYLHFHRHIGLRYSGTASSTELVAYSDSDWAVGRSTSGHTVQWMGCTIAWGSVKQSAIAISTCEAEIYAASLTARTVVYHRYLNAEIGYEPAGPTVVYVDNMAAIAIAYNPEMHGKTKHILRKHLHIREYIKEHKIAARHIATKDNISDFFTKPLAPIDFFRLRDIIMNVRST